MKVSELIEKLKSAIQECGDIEVIIQTNETWSGYCPLSEVSIKNNNGIKELALD